MIDCAWASALTRYDCRTVPAVGGGASALEIATPFSMPGGAAVVLYVADMGSHLLLSDNGDTLAHLSSIGVDLWHPQRARALRDRLTVHGVTLDQGGDFRCLAQPAHAPFAFARLTSAVLAAGSWAAEQLKVAEVERDLVAEAEPYIMARDPAAQLLRRVHVRGASSVEYEFPLQHGRDLIDVIGPTAQASGFAMRKAGDVLNGPFADNASPLVIVDDRTDHQKAHQEIAIIASVARSMAFTTLMRGPLH